MRLMESFVTKFLDKSESAIVKPRDFEKILEYGIVKYEDRIFFSILMATGLRYREFLEFSIHPEWFMPNLKAIHIPERKAARRKIAKDRWVHLSKWGMQITEMFIKINATMPVVTETVKDQSVRDPETGKRTIKTHELRHRWFTPQEAAKRVKRWAKKAGYDPTWFSPKSLRKSHISWLVKVYPDREGDIMLSVGHDLLTDIRYYRGTPFTEDEIIACQKYMNGWN